MKKLVKVGWYNTKTCKYKYYSVLEANEENVSFYNKYGNVIYTMAELVSASKIDSPDRYKKPCVKFIYN